MRSIHFTFHSTLLALALVSCEGAQLREGQSNFGKGPVIANGEIASDANSSGSARSSSDNIQNKPDSSSSPTGASPSETAVVPANPVTANPLVDVEIPEAAYIPISIGGASLTCIAPEGDKLKTTCTMKNKAGATANFTPKKAYFIVYPTLNWIETSFTAGAPGTGAAASNFIVNLPYSVRNRSFAIAFADAIQDVLLDWVPAQLDPIPNTIVDGSFEQNVLDGTRLTQFLTPATQKSWKAVSKVATCNGILEYSNTNLEPQVTAPNGKQWIELDAACLSTGSVSGGDNVTAYQDLSLQVDHAYEISFQYRYRPGLNREQKLKVRFGGEEVLNVAVTSNAWITHKFTRKATLAKTRIEFEEWGDGTDGEGTLIDNVIVTDTGKGPIAAP